MIVNSSIVIREEENLEQMLLFASNAGFKEVMLGFGSSKIFEKDSYEKEIECIQKLLCKYNLPNQKVH